MIINLFLIFVIILSVFFAGLFAGAETGMYQMNLLRLRLGVEKKKLSFIILGRIMQDGPGLLISTLLCTNLSHYIATSIITYLMLSSVRTAHTAELFATIVTAPILFVFAELIPKNLFFYRADSLMPYTSFILYLFKKVFTVLGIVPALKLISRFIRSFGGAVTPFQSNISAVRSPYITAIIRDTKRESLLSPVQTGIINRMAHIGHLTISSVMTALNRVEAVDVNSHKSFLLKKLRNYQFTRLLVYSRSRENIIGYINIYESLLSEKSFSDLNAFVREIDTLPADTIVTDAINIMRNKNQKIVLVTRQKSAKTTRPLGIVTMKDLAEEILGELTEW